MPGKIVVLEDSFIAASDLSAKQFYAVELTAENTVDACNAATDVVVGILQDTPKSGEIGRVMVMGRTKAAVDGTIDIAVGDWLGTNSSGILVKKATADYTVCARALQAFTTNGTGYIDVYISAALGGFFRSAAG